MPYMLGFVRVSKESTLYGTPVYLSNTENIQVGDPAGEPIQITKVDNYINNDINGIFYGPSYGGGCYTYSITRNDHYNRSSLELTDLNQFSLNKNITNCFSSVWINIIGIGSGSFISPRYAGYFYDDGSDGFVLSRSSDNKLMVKFKPSFLNSNFGNDNMSKILDISINNGWHHIAFISIEDKYKAFYLDGKRIIFDFSEYNVDSNLMPTDGGSAPYFSSVLGVGSYRAPGIGLKFNEFYAGEIGQSDKLYLSAPDTIKVPTEALVIE